MPVHNTRTNLAGDRQPLLEFPRVVLVVGQVLQHAERNELERRDLEVAHAHPHHRLLGKDAPDHFARAFVEISAALHALLLEILHARPALVSVCFPHRHNRPLLRQSCVKFSTTIFRTEVAITQKDDEHST
eukprot:3539695-Rhodomonas_salina.1